MTASLAFEPRFELFFKTSPAPSPAPLWGRSRLSPRRGWPTLGATPPSGAPRTLGEPWNGSRHLGSTGIVEGDRVLINLGVVVDDQGRCGLDHPEVLGSLDVVTCYTCLMTCESQQQIITILEKGVYLSETRTRERALASKQASTTNHCTVGEIALGGHQKNLYLPPKQPPTSHQGVTVIQRSPPLPGMFSSAMQPTTESESMFIDRTRCTAR